MKFTDSKILPPGLERSLRFYVTNPSPCPYLPGRRERKAFTNLSITESDLVHNLLSQSGFRRSQTIAYRPACPRCPSCGWWAARTFLSPSDPGGTALSRFVWYLPVVCSGANVYTLPYILVTYIRGLGRLSLPAPLPASVPHPPSRSRR